jgi:hypothetical protein
MANVCGCVGLIESRAYRTCDIDEYMNCSRYIDQVLAALDEKI